MTLNAPPPPLDGDTLNLIDRTSALPTIRFPLPLHTARLRIRPFTPEDASAIFAIHGDPVATRYMQGPLSQEASRDNLAALIDRVTRTGYGPFAAVLAETGEVIGWAGIQQLPGYLRLEILWAFQPAMWRRGYATEASIGLLDVCFRQLALRELVATVDPGNLASIAVLRKLGFEREGPFAHGLVAVSGDLYRLTREQFERSAHPGRHPA